MYLTKECMSTWVSRISLSVLGAAVAAGLFFWVQTSQAPSADSSVVTIAASFYPLAEFSRQVGGEWVEVRTLTPAGVEPHEFEPTPRQLETVYGSDLFVFNGGGIDAWASRIASSVQDQGVSVVQMTQVIKDVLPAIEQEEGLHQEEELFDEHFWLSPRLAQQEVIAISEALIQLDPEHEADYRANTDAFLRKLQQLDVAYREGLASCDLHTAVTSHAAFAYVARDYGFTQLPLTGLSPEEEPSAGALADLVQMSQALGVQYVFFETLVSPELAQTLARELGAQTLVFNPLEGLTEQDAQAGRDYLTIMQDNLHNLRTALVCK